MSNIIHGTTKVSELFNGRSGRTAMAEAGARRIATGVLCQKWGERKEPESLLAPSVAPTSSP